MSCGRDGLEGVLLMLGGVGCCSKAFGEFSSNNSFLSATKVADLCQKCSCMKIREIQLLLM